MRIGITERGDASVDMSWAQLPGLIGYDGAVLITKNITDRFIENVHSQNKPIIVHATCTGWGGTQIEPGVPDYKHQLNQLKKLIDSGFPASHCVLRIDPIFPTTNGLTRLRSVLDHFKAMNLCVDRIRVSIVDEYKHVKARYKANGWTPIYGDNFGPSDEQIAAVAAVLASYAPMQFETCAEPRLAELAGNVREQGCISIQDLDIMGFDGSVLSSLYENPQHRFGCHCLSVKRELLHDKHPCKHNCIYCFWKRPGE